MQGQLVHERVAWCLVLLAMIDRNTFEDEFPVMFKFYSERGRLTEMEMQKVQEVQARWKQGNVFWLTYDNQEVEIPEWVAVNVVLNNRQNLLKTHRICMSLNHTKGYGCNRKEKDGQCSYVHECALCGQDDHGVFMSKRNGDWVCNKLRKWNEEEERWVEQFGEIQGHELELAALAQRPRGYKAPGTANTQRTASAKANGAALAKRIPGMPTDKKAPATTPPNRPQQTQQAQQLNQQPADQLQNQMPQRQPKHYQQHQTPNEKTSQQDPSNTKQQITYHAQPQNGHVQLSNPAQQPIKPAAPPAPSHPPPPRLPSDWEAVWNKEADKYYFWHRSSGTTSWDLPADDTPAKASTIPKCEFVCTQHWRPQPGQPCLRVFQGERLHVTWSEDDSSWVYGHNIDEPDKLGYFPRAVLKKPRRCSISRYVGAVLHVEEAFEAPQEVGGYLSIQLGERVKVLFEVKAPSAWAYVERHGTFSSEAGWVPEICLSDAPS